MYITCLDMEGVLTPEIWIEFSKESGIPELSRTTRDEPDYEKLMHWRMGVLRQHGMGLREIQKTVARIDPLPGARAFLDELRSFSQVIIISDTFEQFALPLMEKLGFPTLFCHSLVMDEQNFICGMKLRCDENKPATVRALKSIGFDIVAAGDSYNDLGMLRAADSAFLFRTTEAIRQQCPDIPAYTQYGELLTAIRKAIR